MALNLDLRQVRKKGGRVHLAVPGAADAAVRTLCNKVFAAGDYSAVADDADCQLCQKRRSDPALVSSAFFEGDVGSQLLEMSLEQARAGRGRRQAERQAAGSERTSSRSASRDSGRRPGPGARGLPEPQPKPGAATELPSNIGDLEMANLSQVSENLYRSPGGVLIRTRRRGASQEVAEIVFDGDAQVKRNPEGMIRIKLGDMIVVYSVVGGELRAHYRHDDAT
jgi:hypothetical protein